MERKSKMTPEAIFQNICEQFQKGQCLATLLQLNSTALTKVGKGDGKPKKYKDNQELLDDAADYLLYRWCQQHNDTRFTKLLDVVIVPVIEPDLSQMTFDEILELLSPATVTTRK